MSSGRSIVIVVLIVVALVPVVVMIVVIVVVVMIIVIIIVIVVGVVVTVVIVVAGGPRGCGGDAGGSCGGGSVIASLGAGCSCAPARTGGPRSWAVSGLESRFLARRLRRMTHCRSRDDDRRAQLSVILRQGLAHADPPQGTEKHDSDQQQPSVASHTTSMDETVTWAGPGAMRMLS